MAKIIPTSAIQVVSGNINGFVYRHQADGSVIVAKAGVRHARYEPIPAQEAQMQKFKEAQSEQIHTSLYDLQASPISVSSG